MRQICRGHKRAETTCCRTCRTFQMADDENARKVLNRSLTLFFFEPATHVQSRNGATGCRKSWVNFRAFSNSSSPGISLFFSCDVFLGIVDLHSSPLPAWDMCSCLGNVGGLIFRQVRLCFVIAVGMGSEFNGRVQGNGQFFLTFPRRGWVKSGVLFVKVSRIAPWEVFIALETFILWNLAEHITGVSLTRKTF